MSQVQDETVVEARVTLTRADFVGASMPYFWRRFRWGFYGCLAVGLLMLWPVLSPATDRPSAGILPPIEFLTLAALSPVLAWLIPFLQFRRVPEEKRTCTWSFYPDRIDVVSATSRGTMQWSTFEKIQEMKSAFLLFPHKAIFYIIPKSTLSPEGVRQLRQLSVAALGKNVKVDFAAYQAKDR